MAPQEPVRRDEFTQLEHRVTQLEETVEAESGLRAMMDHDQARLTTRLDAQDRLLRALSVTQSDHTTRLTRLEASTERLEASTERLEASTERLEASTERLEASTERLEERSLELERVVGHVREGIDTILVLLRDTE
jgi:chromosome segregation ATPase